MGGYSIDDKREIIIISTSWGRRATKNDQGDWLQELSIEVNYFFIQGLMLNLSKC